MGNILFTVFWCFRPVFDVVKQKKHTKADFSIRFVTDSIDKYNVRSLSSILTIFHKNYERNRINILYLIPNTVILLLTKWASRYLDFQVVFNAILSKKVKKRYQTLKLLSLFSFFDTTDEREIVYYIGLKDMDSLNLHFPIQDWKLPSTLSIFITWGFLSLSFCRTSFMFFDSLLYFTTFTFLNVVKNFRFNFA